MTECVICGKKKPALKTIHGRSDNVRLCGECWNDVAEEILKRSGWPTRSSDINSPAVMNQALGAMLMARIVMVEVKDQVVEEILQGKFGKSGVVSE